MRRKNKLMVKITRGDIVRFKSGVTAEAAIFCHNKDITGTVSFVSNNNMLTINIVGFEYDIYSKLEDVELIAKSNEIPIIKEEE
jgi:hypothetical protein